MTTIFLHHQAISRPKGMLQSCLQLSQYNVCFAGENRIFAPTMGPQEAFTVAKIRSAFRARCSGERIWQFLLRSATIARAHIDRGLLLRLQIEVKQIEVKGTDAEKLPYNRPGLESQATRNVNALPARHG